MSFCKEVIIIKILWKRLILDFIIAIFLIIAIFIVYSLAILKYINFPISGIIYILIGFAILFDSYYILRIKKQFYIEVKNKNPQYESWYKMTYYFAIYAEIIIGLSFSGFGIVNILGNLL